jgi:hypothetical protein
VAYVGFEHATVAAQFAAADATAVTGGAESERPDVIDASADVEDANESLVGRRVEHLQAPPAVAARAFGNEPVLQPGGGSADAGRPRSRRR